MIDENKSIKNLVPTLLRQMKDLWSLYGCIRITEAALPLVGRRG
jgi:hypothetical protein